MSATKTVYEVVRDEEVDPGLSSAYTRVQEAAEGDSNDEELDAYRELVDELLSALGARVEESEVPECDECEEEAVNFWPNLREPVQLCAPCTHDAYRSGWEPGQ